MTEKPYEAADAGCEGAQAPRPRWHNEILKAPEAISVFSDAKGQIEPHSLGRMRH
jgi:hypothetical protein